MASASISVIIPAYNAANTVVEAIESVLVQTYSVTEIIVVDDGSTDQTADVVAKTFPSVRLESGPNRGPSGARNHGISVAKGEWIAFLDADDTWHPDKLALQMAVARDGVELIASDWIRGKVFTPCPRPIRETHLAYRDLLVMNQFQTSTVLMTERLVRTLNGFDANVDGAEDWDFWLRASRHTGIVKVDWPLVQYRDVATGYSKDVWRVYCTMQPMLDKHRGTDAISSREFSILEAWHHLRFWVAFYLAHDSGHARAAWHNALQKRLRRFVPKASTTYLLPFLWRRVRHRGH